MAIYRLASYPEPPPEMNRRWPMFLFASVCAAVLCLPVLVLTGLVFIRLGLRESLVVDILSYILAFAVITPLLSALMFRNRKKILPPYGRQTWELTPEGLTYTKPGQPNRFVPVDALLSFSIRKERTTVRAAKPFANLWLPGTVADRDAFWNQLRGMGVPERPPRSFATSLVNALPMLALNAVFLIPLIFSRSLSFQLFGAVGYVLYMGRLEWTSTRRRDPIRSPLRQPEFYVSLLSSTFIVWICLLPANRHHKHRAQQPRSVQASTPGSAPSTPASVKPR